MVADQPPAEVLITDADENAAQELLDAEREAEGSSPFVKLAAYYFAKHRLTSQPPAPGLDEASVERVARAICKFQKQDPDELIAAGNPIGEPCDYPAWMFDLPLAREIVAAFPAAVQKDAG